MFIALRSFAPPGAEKGMFQPRLFCDHTGITDTGSLKIDTEETPAGKTVKPFVFAHCTGVMVGAHRADAHIAVLCHYLSLLEWR
jgi:hypothetical protein